MEAVELLFGLLVAVAILVTVARRVGLPYPILLVLGGLALGAVPGLPAFELEPELVFLLFLPPILFAAAFFTSVRDFRANARPIALLAVGLVLFTTIVVAVVARVLLPELPWPAAFALGAIVSPPDAIAATAVAQRLGVTRRVVVILEGESLVNDATALVAYRAAVAAAATGTFVLGDEALRFVVVGVAGAAMGLAVGAVTDRLLALMRDPPVVVLVSLLTPFAAYVPAEALGFSGVLATVAAGIYLGRRAPRTLASDTRLLGGAVWQMVTFVINGVVFILIGLQLPGVLADLSDQAVSTLVISGIGISATVIVSRLVWVFPATYVPRMLSRRLREREPSPPWQPVFIIGWAGMRGVVSLAAALALPSGFPERGLLIFLTFCVILATLVGQGLTLPILIRRLGVGDDGSEANEEKHARAAASEAALARLDVLAEEWPDHRPLIASLRERYEHRLQHVSPDPEERLDDQEEVEHELIRQAIIQAERDAVIALRDRGIIADDVLRRVERDLDLEELRMEA